MRYIANPVEVEAVRIREVKVENGEGRLVLFLEDGETFYPDKGMLARMTPKAGDYLVRQEDGYVYLNPKDVFERKYRLAHINMDDFRTSLQMERNRLLAESVEFSRQALEVNREQFALYKKLFDRAPLMEAPDGGIQS